MCETLQTPRNNPNLYGKNAYEADLKLTPFYHDGTTRPQWSDLSKTVQWSWEKPLFSEKANHAG